MKSLIAANLTLVNTIILSVQQLPVSGADLLIVDRHACKFSRTPLNEWPARRRGRYLQNTQETQEANIRTLSGTRTSDPRNRMAANLGGNKYYIGVICCRTICCHNLCVKLLLR